MSIQVTEITPADGAFVQSELVRNWRSTEIYSRRRPFAADRLEGFVAWRAAERVGHLTFARLESGEFEVVTLSAAVENCGAGSALLDAAVARARRDGAARLMLTTSNDNLHALRFYQRRGWRIVEVHRGVIDELRRMKPVPEIGMNGIPLHDEIELEFPLER